MAADWDKLSKMGQFFGLLTIPVTIVGLIGSLFIFKEQQASNAQQALNQERQNTLDNYLNEMSNLVLNYKLATSPQHSSVNALAIAQTDTAVRYLDNERKGELIRYLWESYLITGASPVMSLSEIDLNGADFAGANLRRINLSTDSLVGAQFSDAKPYGAYLSWADLSGADLTGADLSCFKNSHPGISGGILGILARGNFVCTGAPGGADLVHANLSGADLRGASLVGANLSKADLNGAELKGATYNSKPIPQGSLIVPPTEWPRGFNPVARGAICVAYC